MGQSRRAPGGELGGRRARGGGGGRALQSPGEQRPGETAGGGLLLGRAQSPRCPAAHAHRHPLTTLPREAAPGAPGGCVPAVPGAPRSGSVTPPAGTARRGSGPPRPSPTGHSAPPGCSLAPLGPGLTCLRGPAEGGGPCPGGGRRGPPRGSLEPRRRRLGPAGRRTGPSPGLGGRRAGAARGRQEPAAPIALHRRRRRGPGPPRPARRSAPRRPGGPRRRSGPAALRRCRGPDRAVPGGGRRHGRGGRRGARGASLGGPSPAERHEGGQRRPGDGQRRAAAGERGAGRDPGGSGRAGGCPEVPGRLRGLGVPGPPPPSPTPPGKGPILPPRRARRAAGVSPVLPGLRAPPPRLPPSCQRGWGCPGGPRLTPPLWQEAYVEYLKSIAFIAQALQEEAVGTDGSEVVTPDTPKMLKLAEQCLERVKSIAAALGKAQAKPAVQERGGGPAPLPRHRRVFSDEGGKLSPFLPPEIFQKLQIAEAQSTRKELTPLEEASLQNQKLKAAYEARVARLNPSQALQKTSLTLSLQRQMMENLVIAKAREETLQRKMEERRLRLQEAANR
uniref:VPS9 domain containing 1 n=1 Tax=Falco tinnunculus TaxID=100819 RepID=A0A8C4U1G1_FALTI